MTRLTIAIALFVSALAVSAQDILPNRPQMVGDQITYRFFYDGGILSNYNWTADLGVVQSMWRSGSNYYATINWNGAGSSGIYFYGDGNMLNTITIMISCFTPDPATTLTAATSGCSPRQVSYSGAPPAGYTWYWVSSPTGVETTYSGSTYNTFSTGTVYLRARETSGTCWSTNTASIYVTVSSTPNPPSSIIVSSNVCDAKTLTRGTPPTGVTWYWEGLDPNGMDITYSGSTYQASSSGTYIIRARDNTTLCWSQPSTTLVTLGNPLTPAIPTTTNVACGGQTLHVAGSPGGSVAWYWQGINAQGKDMAWPATTDYTAATYPGTNLYYLRAYNSSNTCWSIASSSVASTSTPTPSTPTATLTVSGNACGSKTITFSGSTPPNESWYWQGADPNGMLVDPNPVTTASVTGQYFLRSRYGNTSCWSTPQQIYVSINQPPAVPPAPTTTTLTCSSQTLSKVGSPPPNTQWLWQGTVNNGPDTSPVATAATYTAPSTGTYYLNALSSAGCWSTSSAAVSVTVSYAPPAAPPMPLATTNTCASKFLTKPSAPSGITYFWETGSNNTDATSLNATAATLEAQSTGNYYLRAKDNNGNCWSAATTYVATIDPVDISIPSYDPINTTIQATHSIRLVPGFFAPSGSTFNARIAITAECNNLTNWEETIAYDVNGNVVGDQRTYLNGFGKQVQSQTIDKATGKILGTQVIFDSFSQPRVSTLPAPILESGFIYKKSLALNQAGQPYSASDFDIRTGTNIGSVSNPAPFGNQPGTIGWYYSSANDMEPATPTTQFPYSRSFVLEGPDPTKSTNAKPGDVFRMGAGHEDVTEKFLISTISPDELQHYYQIKHFYSSSTSATWLGYKQISTDANGNKTASFVDANGKVLATAIVTSTNNAVTPPVHTYANWSYNYYNDAGLLVAKVAPNGVNTTSTDSAKFVTRYTYDHKGLLIETKSPDEGKSQFVYSTDGKIRFSQNSDQRAATPPRFSYTNYDYLGRLVESGEYTCITGGYVFEPSTTLVPSGVSVLLLIDRNFAIPIDQAGPSSYSGISYKSDNTRCKDYKFITYDVAGSGAPSTQSYLYGRVSKTENANAITWYSYDELGRLLWTKQSISGLGIKTIDYTYDFFGNVTQVAYQAGQTDKFYYHYEYDNNQRLINAYTSFDGISKTLQATYKYYVHGPLKRMELAGNLQGVDYIYTVSGALKSINHSDVTKDPGNDGSNGFQPDVYGQTFNYYDNDYAGAGYSAGTVNAVGIPNQYNGLIKAQSWFTPVDIPSTKKVYGYTYDNLYQLQNAQFGALTGVSGNYTASFSIAEAYREGGLTYDKNGNIQTLIRKGKTGNSLANYGYVYEANTNRLDKVNNGGGLLTDYAYNSIGQMTQQVEGTKTMNVLYDPYGLTKEVRNGSNNLVTSYAYDDRGNRIRKTVYSSGTASRNTFYVNDAKGNILAIYEQTLPGGAIVKTEAPVYGSDRIGIYKPVSNSWFYELNDHLGNVRAVIGPPRTEVFTATMETEAMATEDLLFKKIDPRITNTLANNTPGGNEAIRVNNGQPNGGYPGRVAASGITLKVSPGDVISAEVYGYYEGGTGYNNSIPSAAIISSVAAIFGGSAGATGDPGKIYNAFNSSYTGGGGFAGPSGNTAVPAAYLNMIMFDQNLMADPTNLPMSAVSVTSAANGARQKISIGPITIPSPGFVYIFVNSNSDSPNWVYFDDLKVTQLHSPFVAGADFYPFGLAMSDREIKAEPYRFGYQGQFSEKDTTTNWNEFDLRMYEARYGRWISPDPYGQFQSPYMAMGNNPVIHIDRTGGVSNPFGEGMNVIPNFISGPTSTLVGNVIFSGIMLNEIEVRGLSLQGAGLKRAEFAKSLLGKWHYNNDGEVVRTGKPLFLLKFDDKYTDCVETTWYILKNTDPEIYENSVGKDKFGRTYGNVETFRSNIKKNYNATYRWTNPMPGDLLIYESHIETIVDVKMIHGRIFLETVGSLNDDTKVPTLNGLYKGINWLEPNSASAAKLAPKPYGIWTPPLSH